MKKNILVTGSAGFIGFHLVNKLAASGFNVTGLDNLNDYYDINLKIARLKQAGINYNTGKKYKSGEYIKSTKSKNYRFVKADLMDADNLIKIFKSGHFNYVIHLAAQAGIRYSLENPRAYAESNIIGYFNLLEAVRQYKPEHFIFASSSSVYGNNRKVPFSVKDKTDEPVSFYAATKKSNEVIAHAYSFLYGLRVTGLRFFTVYGPWGRPDMAYYSFANRIIEGKKIKLFNNGKMKRDFTYIDDIIEGISNILKKSSNKSKNSPGFRLYNLGNSKPVSLIGFVKVIENALKIKAKIFYSKSYRGDVKNTYADISDSSRDFNFYPVTNIKEGMSHFVEWLNKYRNGIYGKENISGRKI